MQPSRKNCGCLVRVTPLLPLSLLKAIKSELRCSRFNKFRVVNQEDSRVTLPYPRVGRSSGAACRSVNKIKWVGPGRLLITLLNT